MAVAAAIVIANNYYNQPLLVDFAKSFGVSERAVGLVPILTQAGYAAGLILLLPLGDMVERRRLIVATLGLAALALAAAALARNLAWLAAASFAIGFASIVPQILPPFAAQLTAPRERGSVVGIIMGGLLCGILLSRVVAGFVALYLGWQAIYWMAAVAMLGLAASLWVLLPRAVPSFSGRYGALLLSLGTLLKTEPVLRETSAVSALQFAAFSAFWSTLAFYLFSQPEAYGSAVAGGFGLAGIVGVFIAPLAGKLADRGNPRLAVLWSSMLLTLAYLIFAFSRGAIPVLVLGVILLDLAMQAGHVSNMTRNYELQSEAISRINTVYMGTRFIGGALGASFGNFAWSFWGWWGVCGTGVLLTMGAVAIQIVALRMALPTGSSADGLGGREREASD